MRLFIALCPDSICQEGFCQAIELLRKNSLSGNFTRRENLHLTLAFLGETSRLAAAEQALSGMSAKPFLLKTAPLGRFPQPGGDVCWIGLEHSPELETLHRKLARALSEKGFFENTRIFCPHITLGREVRLTPGADLSVLSQALQPFKISVTQLVLMESLRERGQLVYRVHQKHRLSPAPFNGTSTAATRKGGD